MRTLTPIWITRGLTSDLWKEMDKMLDVWSTPGLRSYDDRSAAFASEVSETDDQFIISVDLPGLKKEDLKIETANGILTVSGERKREFESENSKVHSARRNYGAFKQSFNLPDSINTEEIQAHFENGVLEIFLPKKEVQQARQIEIKSTLSTPATEKKSELSGQI